MALTEGERDIIREQEEDARPVRPLTHNEVTARLSWLLTPAARHQPMLTAQVVHQLVLLGNDDLLQQPLDDDDMPF